MRRIAVINQKGGVGKTTTTVNLAAALATAGRRVCVMDLDPQAHASTHLGVEPDGSLPSVYDVLVANKPLAEVRRPAADNLWVVPSDINLAAAEVELAGIVGREVILREAMARDPEAFDFAVMDCGPSLGVLTLNALAAADEVFIPLQPHFLALHGLSKLLETTALVARRINPKLTVGGVVVCLYDAATKLAQEVVTDLAAFLDRSRGANVPWAHARVFETKIRRNIKLAECPSFGKSVFAYAPKSPGAADYTALANEVLGVATGGTVIGPLKVTDETPANRMAVAAKRVYNPPMLRVSVANPYEYPLEFQRLKDAARAVFEGEGVAACKVTVAFVDNPHIHRLNKQFLNHDEPTDVLTFPYTDYDAKVLEGEVVIGYEVATEYAADRNHDVNLELLLYVVHGCLHLCGYDDTDDGSAAEMRKKEREYLAKLGLPDIAG